MKIQWNSTERHIGGKRESARGEQLDISKITVSHSQSETFIRLENKVIIMPPAVMKRLYLDLKKNLAEWEAKHGVIRMVKGKKKRHESTAKKVLKALYKSRKVGSKMISINTSKRK